MTITEIDKKYQDAMLNQQKMIADQKEAESKANRLKEEAEKAAAAGDLQKFKDLRAEAADAEALAYVLDKLIENTGEIVTEEEAKDAWKKYAEAYSKKISAGMKNFRETKLDMIRQYAEMVAIQRDACATRERLSRYIGKSIAPVAQGKDADLEKRFPMEYIPCDPGTLSVRGSNIEDPDAAYYLASLGKTALDLTRDPEAASVIACVRTHRA